MNMTTLTECITNFSALGYRGSFRAEESWGQPPTVLERAGRSSPHPD